MSDSTQGGARSRCIRLIQPTVSPDDRGLARQLECESSNPSGTTYVIVVTVRRSPSYLRLCAAAERDGVGLDDLVADEDSVSIAAVTYAELLHGVEMAEGRRRQRRQRFVEAVATEVPIVAYDRRVAATHATLLAAVQRAGRPRGAHDLIIAATAATYDLTVVTSDPGGFEDLPGVAIRPGR